MTDPDLTLKSNDTLPVVNATLSDLVGPIDLTTATQVKFIAKGTASVGAVTVTGVCTIVDAANGQVRYSWIAADTVKADTYNVEFEITWTGGAIETVPNDGYKQIQIVQDLG